MSSSERVVAESRTPMSCDPPPGCGRHTGWMERVPPIRTVAPHGVVESRVLHAVLADPVCAALLERLPGAGLGEWWLTGGATFQNVWNAVTGQEPGHGIQDYDVFFFDSDTSWEAEDVAIRRVDALCADLPAPVEVRNQARVHLWYEQRFGVPAAPFTSARDGIDHFAATTCCVGVTRGPDGLEIHAPHGLEDVLAGRMRPNPLRAPRGVYEDKVRQYRQRWPFLTADPWPGEVVGGL